MNSSILLESLGLELEPPTRFFTGWAEGSGFPWITDHGLLDKFPPKLGTIRIDGCEIGYLFNEDVVIETAKENATLPFLPIGAAADASWMVVDTRVRGELILGFVYVTDVVRAENGEFTEAMVESANMSFSRWLELLMENPLRTDVPR